MGDLQRSLGLMLGEKGCDEHLLRADAPGGAVDKISLMFTNTDQTILRQYECGSEPVLLLSKFFQLDDPSSHLVLVHLRARIAQLREHKFEMYADISHSPLEVLTGRNKTETVLADDATDREDHGRVEPMHPCIARFRTVFANDLEVRAGLVTVDPQNEHIRMPVTELPVDMAVSCILNPLVGGKNETLSCCRKLVATTNFQGCLIATRQVKDV
jgi:hypothetical protein